MFGSTVIEIGIGLSLIYVLLSLLCTVAGEAGSRLLGRRGALLRAGIDRMLGDRDLTERLYKHPLVLGISKPASLVPWWRAPECIPSPLFARVLLDVLAATPRWKPLTQLVDEVKHRDDPELTELVDQLASSPYGDCCSFVAKLDRVRARAAEVMPDHSAIGQAERGELLDAIERVRVAAQPAGEQADDLAHLRAACAAVRTGRASVVLGVLLGDPAITNLEGARAAVAAWFINGMASVTEVYKRQAQTVVFLVAAALAVSLNVDTIAVANRFAHEESLRERVADLAPPFSEKHADLARPAPEEPVAPQPISSGDAAQSRADAARSTDSADPESTPLPSATLDLLEWKAELDSLNVPIGWPTARDAERACEGRREAQRIAEAARAQLAGATLDAKEASATRRAMDQEARQAALRTKRAALKALSVQKKRAASKEKANDDTAKPPDDPRAELPAESAAQLEEQIARAEADAATAISDATAEELAIAKTEAAAAERSLVAATVLLSDIRLRAHLPLPCDAAPASARPGGGIPWTQQWIPRLIGWLLTAFAAALGTRFWFDVLGRLVDIRKAAPPPPKADGAATDPAA